MKKNVLILLSLSRNSSIDEKTHTTEPPSN